MSWLKNSLPRFSRVTSLRGERDRRGGALQMRASGDRSLGLAGVRPWAGDVVRALRVRERVNERFLANTLRGVSSANARTSARRQIVPEPRAPSRAECERSGGAVADEAAVGGKRRRNGDDVAGKHAEDDPSANRESNPTATGFPRDVDSDERLAALLNRSGARRRGGGAARTTGGYALIPEPAFAADELLWKNNKKAEKKQKKKKKKKAEKKSKSKSKTRG